MSDTLNQSEIDALLAAASEPEQAPDSAGLLFSRSRREGPSPEVREYDFKRPERVSKDQMRSLQTLHEAFSRNFGAAMSGYLRTIVEVKVASCEQMTYSEFTGGLPNPTSFNLVEADGLEGQMCLEISPLIIFPIIDRLLGGNTQELFIPQRPLTLIETRLIGNVTKRALTALAEAWANLRAFEFRVSASESNPQLVQIVPPNEVVVVIAFELKMSNRAGTMNLCIPYNVIEPVMEQLSSQNWFAHTKSQAVKGHVAQISGLLSRAPLELTAVLAETTMTLHDLVQLAPGQIVTTERSATAPVALEVEGERKFASQIGQHKGRRALRIIRATGPDERI
ncbi:MAG: flagellar motor switch protein FliM [Planctomycetota bacterium]|nr:flagellar motor switch protein FliM [Planctomycetota bacterium]